MVKYAAVELGGMTIRAAIAEDTPENITDRKLFKHEGVDPAVAIAEVVEWLKARQPFVSLGIASFGPIDPRKGSPTFGQITSTPKVLWRNFNVYKALDVFGVPVGFDTDVNAPAIYEYMQAKAQPGNEGMSSCAYITVGTGIGIGLVVNGKPVHGMLHPEGGHMPYPAPPNDKFGGKCLDSWTIPDGAEANASAPALAKRAGVNHADELAPPFPDDHPVWDEAAHYLAGCCVNLALLASPEKIVIGGGVMNRTILFAKIRRQVQAKLNGYLSVEQITDDEKIKEWIVPAVHGDETGIVGAMALSQNTFLEAGGAKDGACSSSSSSGGGVDGCCSSKPTSSSGSSSGGGKSAFDATSFVFGVAFAALVGSIIAKSK